MTTRVEAAVQQHPQHEAAIRLLAERDPSGNLKYLHWGIRMLVVGQALAPEIADVVDLFHRFSGQPHRHGERHGARRGRGLRTDLYSYRPQDLAGLRDLLLKMKRAQDRKKKARERLYRLEGPVDADVVYEAADLLVRHVRNKAASMRYGLGTKWCIAMKAANYFDGYDSQNATFFFLERKVPVGNGFDKSAIMVSRNAWSDVMSMQVFTALDECVDLMVLAREYGWQAFDFLRVIYARSVEYPGSVVARVLGGVATAEELERALAAAADKRQHLPADRLVEAICCNEAAPWSLLERVARDASAIVKAAEQSRMARNVLALGLSAGLLTEASEVRHGL